MCSSLLGPVASTFSARALASFNEEKPSSRSLLLKRACTGILILATSHTVRTGGAAVVGGGGGGSTLYSGLYVEAPPERGTFFRPKVYERVVILLVEVYERVGCYSPLDGRVTPPAVCHRYPFIHLGDKRQSGVKLTCLRKQCDRRGLNPRPLDSEFEVLTAWPHMPPLITIQITTVLHLF